MDEPKKEVTVEIGTEDIEFFSQLPCFISMYNYEKSEYEKRHPREWGKIKFGSQTIRVCFSSEKIDTQLDCGIRSIGFLLDRVCLMIKIFPEKLDENIKALEGVQAHIEFIIKNFCHNARTNRREDERLE
jgi:hypothetical protein